MISIRIQYKFNNFVRKYFVRIIRNIKYNIIQSRVSVIYLK